MALPCHSDSSGPSWAVGFPENIVLLYPLFSQQGESSVLQCPACASYGATQLPRALQVLACSCLTKSDTSCLKKNALANWEIFLSTGPSGARELGSLFQNCGFFQSLSGHLQRYGPGSLCKNFALLSEAKPCGLHSMCYYWSARLTLLSIFRDKNPNHFKYFAAVLEKSVGQLSNDFVNKHGHGGA